MIALPLIYMSATPKALAYKLMPLIFKRAAILHCSLIAGKGRIQLHDKGLDLIVGKHEMHLYFGHL